MSGPPPKREEERRRRNKDVVPVEKVDIAELVGQDVEIPVADPDWHGAARSVYESFTRSGQAIFYEPSDWSFIYVTCENLSRLLMPQPIVVTDEEGNRTVEMHTVPMKGADFAAFIKAMGVVLATEGERRRSRIELERADAKNKMGDGVLPEGVPSLTQRREDAFRRNA